MSKYIVTNATTVGPGAGSAPVDIEIREGRLDRILSAGEGDPDAFDPSRQFDADGRLVSPPLIEAHTHLYCALTAGVPRWNGTGTLEEGWRLWNETKADIGKEDYKRRAKKVAGWFAANGITRVRTHIDVNSSEHALEAVEAMIEVREELAGLVDRTERALDVGLDVVGGIPIGNTSARTASNTSGPCWICPGATTRRPTST